MFGRHYWYLQMVALTVVFYAEEYVSAFSAVGLTTTTTTIVAEKRRSLLVNKSAATTTTTTTTTPLGNSRFHSISSDKRSSTRLSRSSQSSSSSSSSSLALAMISRQSMEQLGVFLGIMTILQRRALWKIICNQWAYIQTLSRSNQLLVGVASCTAVYAGIVRPFWSWYKASSSLQDEDANDGDNKDTSTIDML